MAGLSLKSMMKAIAYLVSPGKHWAVFVIIVCANDSQSPGAFSINRLGVKHAHPNRLHPRKNHIFQSSLVPKKTDLFFSHEVWVLSLAPAFSSRVLCQVVEIIAVIDIIDFRCDDGSLLVRLKNRHCTSFVRVKKPKAAAIRRALLNEPSAISTKSCMLNYNRQSHMIRSLLPPTCSARMRLTEITNECLSIVRTSTAQFCWLNRLRRLLRRYCWRPASLLGSFFAPRTSLSNQWT